MIRVSPLSQAALNSFRGAGVVKEGLYGHIHLLRPELDRDELMRIARTYEEKGERDRMNLQRLLGYLNMRSW